MEKLSHEWLLNATDSSRHFDPAGPTRRR